MNENTASGFDITYVILNVWFYITNSVLMLHFNSSLACTSQKRKCIGGSMCSNELDNYNNYLSDINDTNNDDLDNESYTCNKINEDQNLAFTCYSEPNDRIASTSKIKEKTSVYKQFQLVI